MCHLGFWVDWKYGTSKMASKITSFISIAYYINFEVRWPKIGKANWDETWYVDFVYLYEHFVRLRFLKFTVFGISAHSSIILKKWNHPRLVIITVWQIEMITKR